MRLSTLLALACLLGAPSGAMAWNRGKLDKDTKKRLVTDAMTRLRSHDGTHIQDTEQLRLIRNAIQGVLTEEMHGLLKDSEWELREERKKDKLTRRIFNLEKEDYKVRAVRCYYCTEGSTPEDLSLVNAAHFRPGWLKIMIEDSRDKFHTVDGFQYLLVKEVK